MYSLNDLRGSRIFDASDEELGVVEGISITLPENRVYLRVKGDLLQKVRGRKIEFIPLNEVDSIDDRVYTYKDLKSLEEVLKKINMEYEDVHMVANLIGMDVKTSGGEIIGVVKDVGLSKKGRELFFIVSGDRIRELRGNDSERIPFLEILKIADQIEIGLEYDILRERLSDISD